MNKWTAVILGLAVSLPVTPSLIQAQPPADAESARRHADRFLELLKRRPSFGTALERVCSYHLEHGSLDDLLEQLQSNPPTDPDAVVQTQIAGMLMIQRGQAADALPLLQEVEPQRSGDPIASLALGLAARAAGDNPAAVAALERAIERRPSKSDLRTIYHDLARLHQQAGRPEEALNIWQELEEAFPRDTSIREDVAARLQADGQLQPALKRWQTLAGEATSPERRTQYQLAVADIQMRLGRHQAALATLEAELREVRPDSWLDQLIRTRIESALMADDGRAAVHQYYQQRLQTYPDDVTSRHRLADLLAADGRTDEAIDVYRQAIRRRPTSAALRTSLINVLVAQGRVNDAVTAARELVELDEAGTDEFELAGQLLLRDISLEPADREQQASAIWMRICGDRQDASRLGYTARLHRRHGLATIAVDLYREVIRREPRESVWRDELGETLFEMGDRNGALQVWSRIADGPRRSTQTLVRLSEILEQAGETSRAVTAMQQACELTPAIADRVRLARLLRRTGQADEAYQELDLAARSATSDVDRQVIREARQEAWRQDPALHLRISALRQKLEQHSADAAGWLQLARMYQTDQAFADALRCAEQSLALQPRSAAGWQAAAEISFQAGLLSRAADASRQLADVSPQQRIPALQQVVRLEQQLGRTEQALEAAEMLVTESPGHSESCRQFAELCFQSGRDSDGLNALRDCLRRNPADVRLAVETAEILAEQFQTDDAASLLWQTFDQVTSQQDRVTLIESLIDLAGDDAPAEPVIQRLTAATSLAPVDRTLCVASAIRLTGDLQRAHDTLESASRQYGQDVRLLRMLVELAEAMDHLELATRYQQQVTRVSSTAEEEVRLATLRFRTGQLSESELSWIRDARSGTDTAAAIRSIDRFLESGRTEAAELMCQRLAADRPHDWRVLYRLAMIQWRLDRRPESVSTLQQLLQLDLPDDHTFTSADPETAAAATAAQDSTVTTIIHSPLVRRLNQIAVSLNWLQLYTGDERYSQNLTAPADFGAARCAAVSFLWLAAEGDERRRLLTEAVTATDDSRGIADWCTMTVTARRSSSNHTTQAAELMARLHQSSDIEHQLVLVGLLCDGGVFRLPADRAADDLPTPSAERLATAAETVALTKPRWLSDVGGWPAVVRRLNSMNQSAALDNTISRLLATNDTNPTMSATDLAFAREDISVVERCLTRLMEWREQAPVVAASLSQRQTQLALLAKPLSADNDQMALVQVIELMLRLNATRYVAMDMTDDSDHRTFHLIESTPTPAGTSSASADQAVRRPSADNGQPAEQAPLQDHLDARLADLLDDRLTAQIQSPFAEALRTKLRSLRRDENDPVWIGASLALAHCELLRQQTDEAMLYLVDVVRRLPDDVTLRLMLAKYLQEHDADSEALQLLSQLPPQRRRETILQTELFALELCASTQNQDRARLAANRLFELQLNPDDVDAVTGHLRAAGLAEVAQRFAARLGSTSVGGAEQLRLVMQQYFDAGNVTAAVRIARQFVLQPAITLDGTSVIVSVQLRRAAIDILVASDAIQPMTRRLQQQLRDGTASFHQRHLLVELLRADGREEAAEDIAAPLRRSLVEDPQSGLQLARQLERQGRLESACDVCRYLLEADASLFHRDYYRFIRLFEKNGRLEELARLVLAADLSQETGGHWGLQQLTERLLPRDEALGLQLFQAAWRAWPDSHQALLANIADDAVWQTPEVLAYSRRRLLPTQDATVQPWVGIAEKFEVQGRGRVTGQFSRLLPHSENDAATRDAEAFGRQIAEALQTHPDWLGGHLYRLVLNAMTDPSSSSVIQLDEFLDRQLDEMPPNVAWVLACELHRLSADEFAPTVIRLLEYLHDRQESGSVLLRSGSSWDSTPDFLLLQLCGQQGDREKAQSVIRRLEKQLMEDASATVADAERNSRLTAELDDSLPPDLSDLAKRLQELGRSVPRQPADPSHHAAEKRSGSANQVIQAVRERLL